MDTSKDYYSILGILPTAEKLVIKAAYKAMLNVYHPDKYKGSKSEANSKTLEINEAYRILSNADSRAHYDKEREESFSENFSYQEDRGSDSNHSSSASHTLDDDWKVATKYQSGLSKLEKELERISSRLAFTFRINLLESKDFKRAKLLATELERVYLESYFGTNADILKFAKHLILDGHTDAARELNKAVNILGNELNANHVILNIQKEFKLYSESPEEKAAEKEEARIHEEIRAYEEFKAYEEEQAYEDRNRKEMKMVKKFTVTLICIAAAIFVMALSQ